MIEDQLRRQMLDELHALSPRQQRQAMFYLAGRLDTVEVLQVVREVARELTYGI